jgi:hypothetical protein
MKQNLINSEDFIKNKIHYIREKYVIFDSELAKLYEVETKVLNQSVKRNIERFPENFMFQLDENEFIILRSQIVTSSFVKHGGRRYLPFAFTEQGVDMLSAVLKSNKAIDISIKIMNAFISMRNFLIKNQNIITKFQQIDEKFMEHDKNFEKIFDYMSLNEPRQGVFFNGQIFDAYHFISRLIKKAKNEIILIDNFIDEEILHIFTKTNVKVKILTKNILYLDIKKLEKQYKNIEIKIFNLSHDRLSIENRYNQLILL